jgi:single-stranded-DNA-specific exonuclease
MEKRWIVKEKADEKLVEKLSKELNINTVLTNILIQRGISTFEEAKQFFRPSLSDLHDPFLMLNMDQAVERIQQAMENQENILIYGDYDVDGTTSVALVYSFLKQFYKKIDYYIPDRYLEGYGISTQGIDHAYKNNETLVIALDCGIKAVDKIEYANTKNVDFIICDHHLPGDVIPAATAVLDPKQDGCPYPYKELSGCGVGFKLMQAFAQKQGIPFEKLEPCLDLVAISIAADIVEMKGENRILAYYGLQKLNENPRPGIESILKYSNITRHFDKNLNKNVFERNLTISDLVFTIAPRINAAGRMASGKKSVELLNCKLSKGAEDIAGGIDVYNKERRALDKEITDHALNIIAESKFLQKSKSTVVYYEDWHKGVLGIVASRLTEHHYRPTIVLSLIDGMYTGSARSVKGFDIYKAIDSCNDLLENFGGHPFAAGLSIKKENIDEFVERFEAYVSEHIENEMLSPEINIDSELDVRQISDNFFSILKQFAPFGPGNMSPVFMTKNAWDTGYAKVVGEKHLKFRVQNPQGNPAGFDAIAFGQSENLHIVKGHGFDVCYTIDENVWRGNVSLQLMIKDVKPHNPKSNNSNP